MYKPPDISSSHFTSLEKDMRSVDNVFSELETATEGVVHVSLWGEVHDGVNAFGDER